MQNQINLESMSVESLKALAYDLLGESQRVQDNIRLVNQKIGEKVKQQQEKLLQDNKVQKALHPSEVEVFRKDDSAHS